MPLAGPILLPQLSLFLEWHHTPQQVADVILEVGDVQTDSASEYLSLLRTYPPGAAAKIKLLRGEQELETVLNLHEIPDGYALSYFKEIFGLVVAEDTQGIYISEVLPGSPAARIELRVGDRLVEVQGERVNSLNTLESRIESTLGRLPLNFAIYRGNRGYLVELP